jgi:midasin (ATPase involved in ribosome maturation)
LNAETQQAIENCQETCLYLHQKIDKVKYLSIIDIFDNVQSKLEKLKKKMDILKESTCNQLTFTFVESEFVEAIRNGKWVIVNINSAPQEVIEILNSLIEEKPLLYLYEKSESSNLTLGKGIRVYICDYKYFIRK